VSHSYATLPLFTRALFRAQCDTQRITHDRCTQWRWVLAHRHVLALRFNAHNVIRVVYVQSFTCVLYRTCTIVSKTYLAGKTRVNENGSMYLCVFLLARDFAHCRARTRALLFEPHTSLLFLCAAVPPWHSLSFYRIYLLHSHLSLLSDLPCNRSVLFYTNIAHCSVAFSRAGALPSPRIALSTLHCIALICSVAFSRAVALNFSFSNFSNSNFLRPLATAARASGRRAHSSEQRIAPPLTDNASKTRAA